MGTEQREAREKLRELLPVGSTVRTIRRHVSRSGMSHSISLVIGCEDMSWLAARAGLGKIDQARGGIRVGGAGMDMGFHLVYSLSRMLYPDGHRCIGDADAWGDRCPSNDHSNDRVRDYSPARVHADGGYALRHRWL